MNWLEILPLLKRLLPLLGRLTPLLESYTVSRISSGAETRAALEQFSGGLRAEIASSAENDAELRRLLAGHGESLQEMTAEIRRMSAANLQYGARLESAEAELTSLGKWLRAVSAVTLLLLLVCVGLLVALYLRR